MLTTLNREKPVVNSNDASWPGPMGASGPDAGDSEPGLVECGVALRPPDTGTPPFSATAWRAPGTGGPVPVEHLGVSLVDGEVGWGEAYWPSVMFRNVTV